MRRSDGAWMALGGAIIAYEASSTYEELLSCAVDRYLVAHPWLTRTVIALTALHLANLCPPFIDPFHGFGLLILRTKGRRVPC